MMRYVSPFSTRRSSLVFALLLVILLLFVGYRLFRIVRFGWVAYHNGIMLLDTAKRTPQDLAQKQPELAALAEALNGLEEEIAPLAPLLHGLDDITPYGSTVAALPELLTVGAAMATLGKEGLLLVDSSLTTKGENSLVETVAASITNGNAAVFTQMAQQARRANTALFSINAESLLPQLAGRLHWPKN